MSDLPFFNHDQFAAFVPDCYARFRRLVSEGLVYFLQELPQSRRMAIVSEQLALSDDTPAAERLVRLLRCCPVLHKLGQVLAHRPELDRQLRLSLQQLETLAPHTPMELLRSGLQSELAPVMRELRISIGSTALAEGSVAVVVPFSWRRPDDADDEPPHAAVAKILRPGVVDLIEQDLAILQKFSEALQVRADKLALPPLPYAEIIDDVKSILLLEIQPCREQANLAEAHIRMAGRNDVVIPELLPCSTGRMTAMQRIEGRPVTDAAQKTPQLRTLAGTIIDRLIADVLFSLEPSVLFHGDPHAGNLFATCDGRLAILDWTLAGHLRKQQCEQLIQVMLGAACGDAEQVAIAVTALAENTPERGPLLSAANHWLNENRPESMLVPSLVAMLRLLDQLAESGVHFPREMLVFRRACFMLEGVIADVNPTVSIESALTATAVERLISEWPMRWVKPPFSRDFASHVSLLDLSGWMLTLAGRLAVLN